MIPLEHKNLNDLETFKSEIRKCEPKPVLNQNQNLCKTWFLENKSAHHQKVVAAQVLCILVWLTEKSMDDLSLTRNHVYL